MALVDVWKMHERTLEELVILGDERNQLLKFWGEFL